MNASATPKRPDRSRNGGSRPSTQKEGVRRSMTQWKFVTNGASASDAAVPLDEATPPVTTRQEQRRLGTSQGGGRAEESAPDGPQSPYCRPPRTACKAVRPNVAPMDARLLASDNSSVTTVSAGLRRSFASTPFAGVDGADPQHLLEYSPAMAAGNAGGVNTASTVEVDIVAPVDEYKVKRENLSLKSVLNAATEAAEESCARAQPWSSEELGRRLLKLPDPASQEPYPASVPIHPSTPPTAMTTRRGRSPPSSLRAPPENLGRCYPLAAGVDHNGKPAATHAVGTVVSSATVSPASAHNTTSADLKAAQRHLEKRKQQRAAMATPGSPVSSLPQLTSSEPEALVLMVPADDDESQAGERRVTFKADKRKSTAAAGRHSPRKPREGPTSPASLAPSSRRGSRRPTASSPISSRVTSPSGASHHPAAAKVPASERSAGSSGGGAESSKDWIAAGGVSKDEPLYKKMAVAIQDMKSEFGFVDENEIRAIDAVLLGLQHAHVHRMYGNLHSLRDASSTFHETTAAPVKPMAPNLLTDTVQLPRAKRAAMDAGGRKRDIVMPRRATDAVETSRSSKKRAESHESSSSARTHVAHGKAATKPPSWTKESDREMKRQELAEGHERALTARFLCHPSELKLEDGPTSTTPGPMTPPTTPPLQQSPSPARGCKASSRASSRATKPLDPFSMTDAQMEAFLAEKAVVAPDMQVFESNIAATPAIAGATQSITRFVDHLRQVMPPEDSIRYTPASTPGARPIGSL